MGMIPYLDLPHLGPVNSFGLLVMLGVFFGSTVGYRHGERLGLDSRLVEKMAFLCGVCGVVGAHLIDVFLYQPGWWQQEGALWILLNPFAGISSYGGIIGGVVGFALFARLSKIEKLKYADAAVFGFLVILTFGRAGCASVHDHVGVATNFVLAVDFPPAKVSGVVGTHHDLGLYEFAYLLLLLPVVAVSLRKPRRPGWVVGFVSLAYAVPRFFVEFLRRESSDPRYFHLTPAQWTSIAVFTAGAVLLIWIYRQRDVPPGRYLKPAAWRSYIRNLVRLSSRVPRDEH